MTRQEKAAKALAKFEKQLAKMDPATANYWRGSASYISQKRVAEGKGKTINVG